MKHQNYYDWLVLKTLHVVSLMNLKILLTPKLVTITTLSIKIFFIFINIMILKIHNRSKISFSTSQVVNLTIKQ